MLVVFSGNCGRSMYHFRLAAIKKTLESGYQVTVVLPKDDYTERLRAENINVVTLSKMELSGTNPFKDYKLYKEYVEVYGKLKPNLIFQYTIKPNIYGSIAAKKLNIPCIAVITGLGYTFTHKGIVSTLAKKMYRFALQKTVQVWFLNTDDKSVFEENRLVARNKTFLLNGEGVDTNYFVYKPIDSSKRSFILISRLLYDKGLKEYYEAAKKLKKTYPTVSFKILGFLNVENPKAISKIQLDEWVKSGAVEYLGSAKDVRPFIETSSCAVLPSFYKEGMSITLMEGASTGRPLIATDIPGCREMIEDGKTGYLCNTKDVDSLAAKMELIINMDDNQLREMGIKSREKMINEFGIQNILPKYEKIISAFAK